MVFVARRMYARHASEPDSRPPPVVFSPPKAPPISAPDVPMAVPDNRRVRERISLRDAADWGWILPSPATNYGRAVRAACRRAEFEPRVAHEVTDTAVSLSMVAQGLGVTAVTKMMLALSPASRLKTIELEEDLRRDVVLITRAGDSQRPMVRAMATVIEESVRGALTPPETASR
jgi:DNA-binding transcriptional LysR family regulator